MITSLVIAQLKLQSFTIYLLQVLQPARRWPFLDLLCSPQRHRVPSQVFARQDLGRFATTDDVLHGVTSIITVQPTLRIVAKFEMEGNIP